MGQPTKSRKKLPLTRAVFGWLVLDAASAAVILAGLTYFASGASQSPKQWLVLSSIWLALGTGAVALIGVVKALDSYADRPPRLASWIEWLLPSIPVSVAAICMLVGLRT